MKDNKIIRLPRKESGIEAASRVLAEALSHTDKQVNIHIYMNTPPEKEYKKPKQPDSGHIPE